MPPPAPWPRSRGSCGSPAAATRASTSTSWSPERRAGWSGWCWSGRRPRSSWTPWAGPASRGRWSGRPRSARPSPSGSAWPTRATPSCSPRPAPARTSSPTTPSGGPPSRPPSSAWPPGTILGVTTVAGRDARRDPAAARPWLGAGSTYWLLLAVVCALLVIGLVMVLSASSVAALAKQGDSYAYFKRQLLWVVGGVVVMLVASRIDYRLWRRLGTPLLVAATAGLVYVLAHPAAVSAYGSTRWISVGGRLTVQPAEFAKLALVLFSADVLTRKARLLGDVRHLLFPVLPLTVLLAGLVMLEPDLGTTLLLCAIAFGMLFVAGTPLLLLGGIGSLGLAGGIALIMSAPYRRSRFFSFMDPAADPQNGGYQFIQGRLALGSGGLLGVGLGAGRQKWSYVPNAHTDFIFAIIGEELGLLGTLSILLLFVAFAYAGVRVAQRAPDPFGRYLASGVTIWIVVQALVNIGAVVGVLPITGVPLPLVSFGGSSMLVLLAATGMLLNVARHEVWTVRAPVIATTTTAAERRGRRTAGRAPARPARGRPAAVTTTRGGPHRQTPAQKAKADAERARRTPNPPPSPAPRKRSR